MSLTVSFEELFDEQQKLLDRMGWPGGKSQEGFRNHILAAQVELVEALCETNWKPWKPDYLLSMSKESRKRCMVELTDVMQFIVNASLCMSFTAEDLSDGLRAKLKINHQRVDNGETVHD